MRAVLVAALLGAAAASECTDLKSQHTCASAAKCEWSASSVSCQSKIAEAEAREKGESGRGKAQSDDDDGGCDYITVKTACEDKGCTWVSASDTCWPTNIEYPDDQIQMTTSR